MKIRNEIWLVKKDASIVKDKKADNGEWLVLYTVAVGFQTVTSTATFISLGDIGPNLHLSCSLEPETTFPEMMASFYDENEAITTSSLKHYGFDLTHDVVRKHTIDVVKYAAMHEHGFEKEDLEWKKV